MSKKNIVQPLAVRGLVRLLEKLTGMRVALSHPRARGTCSVCQYNVALRNDGTTCTHYSATPTLPRNCPGSNQAAV